MTKPSVAWRSPKPGESLAQYVRAARESRSLTQDDMVRKTDLSLATIRKVENGTTLNPGVFTWLQIWRALGMPLNAIEGLPAPRTVAAGRNAARNTNRSGGD